MIEYLPYQKELIKEEIRQLRLFATRHHEWRHELTEPYDLKWNRFFRDELNSLADEMERRYFGVEHE